MKKILSRADLLELRRVPLAIVIAKGHTCPACIPVTERIASLAARYPAVAAYEVWIEDVPQFRGEYLIFSVPTVIVIQVGKELLRQSRYFDYEKIESLLAFSTFQAD
ncbi:MAG: thioredoxin family protein [Candidatus Izemoplasmatales bacterium]